MFKKSKDAKPLHKSANSHTVNRLWGFLLALLAMAVLVIFGFFYLQKVTQREKLAAYLPAGRSVALLEYNLQPGRPDAVQLLQIAGGNAWLKQTMEGAQALIPYQPEFQKWYSGRGGLALLTSVDGRDFRAAAFLGVSDSERVADWIKLLLLDEKHDAVLDENYFGQKMISFRKGQYLQILWTREYLVFAEEKEVIESIARTLDGENPGLRDLPAYNQLVSALPEQNLGFFYLDRGKLLHVLGKNETFLTGRLQLFKLYFPFLNLISTEAVALRLDDTDGQPVLGARHLQIFNTASLSDRTLFETDYFYDGSLEKYLPSGSVFVAGGANMLDQKNKLQSYLTAAAPLNELLFQGSLNALQDMAGTPGGELNLERDFFPVFQNNYLFFLDLDAPQKVNFGLLVESEQPANDALRLEKIILAAGPRLASQILAKPSPVTLPDGTVGQEMKAELSVPSTRRLQVNGLPVEQIEFSPDFSVYLASDHDRQLLVVGDSLKKIQDILAVGDGTAAPAMDFGLNKPTEIYHLDIGRLPALFQETLALQPLRYMRAARKITEIGILSNYQFGL